MTYTWHIWLSYVSIPKYRTRTSHMAAMYYTQGGQTYTWHTDCVHMTHMDELCHALMHHTTHTLMTAWRHAQRHASDTYARSHESCLRVTLSYLIYNSICHIWYVTREAWLMTNESHVTPVCHISYVTPSCRTYDWGISHTGTYTQHEIWWIISHI